MIDVRESISSCRCYRKFNSPKLPASSSRSTTTRYLSRALSPLGILSLFSYRIKSKCMPRHRRKIIVPPRSFDVDNFARLMCRSPAPLSLSPTLPSSLALFQFSYSLSFSLSVLLRYTQRGSRAIFEIPRSCRN